MQTFSKLFLATLLLPLSPPLHAEESYLFGYSSLTHESSGVQLSFSWSPARIVFESMKGNSEFRESLFAKVELKTAMGLNCMQQMIKATQRKDYHCDIHLDQSLNMFWA